MNKVVLTGRLVAAPEIKYTTTGKCVANFRIAVDNGYGDHKQTSFINCVAWQKTAELIGNHFDKGSPILISDARISTRTYDAQDGTKRYVTEVIVQSVEFMGGQAKQYSKR